MPEASVMIRDRVRKFVLEDLARGKNVTMLRDDESLVYSGLIDSLGIFKLVAFLEDSFRLRIADEDISAENFESIETIGQFLCKMLKK